MTYKFKLPAAKFRLIGGITIKVAIIGAGLSGLVCAYELEKFGITPAIFEKNNYLGETSGFARIILHIFDKDIGNSIIKFRERYGLDIEPLSVLRELTMISPKEKTLVKGNLGYIFMRGTDNNSLEKQIKSKIKTPITFNSDIKIDDAKDKFDYIVDATATQEMSRKFGIWRQTFASCTRIVIVSGDFKTDSVTIWFNEEYAKKAFGYLVPSKPNQATLGLIVDNISMNEMDSYWNNFLAKENVNYPISNIIEVEHRCGHVSPLKFENIYFIGDAGGLTDNIIGIGGLNAIESGILAARSIAEGMDYNESVQPMVRNLIKLDELRKTINTFDNSKFDKLVLFLGLPVIKQLIYNNPFFKVWHISFLVKFYNYMRGIK